MLYIGIDLGTSACKLLLVDEKGCVRNTVSKEYPLCFPHPGWSEQDPGDWWTACREGVPELLAGFDAREVRGMGVGGQMHGLVALDETDAVLRPAILWNDGRTAEETAWLNDTVGRPVLSARTGNIAFAGFTAPKLLWMKKHEPELFARIRKIMLPKDYLVYCLTGVHATDYSDASGMLLLDVEHKCWSRDMLALCGISESQMPRLYESFAPVGTLLPETAAGIGPAAGCDGMRGCGGQRGGGRGHRDGEHRSGPCGQQVQYLFGHFRHHFYFLGKVWRGRHQRPARFCPCGRRLASDGLYAQRSQLQQMVAGCDHRHE